ncbi:hypothetical protein ACLMJK_001574 [Lecanora helva]
MPASQADLNAPSLPSASPTELPFPPLTKSHILNCSYHSWYPRYRALTPKARLIHLSPPFLSYLRADGIRLPLEPTPPRDQDVYESSSDGEDEEQEETEDPSQAWQDIHQKIKDTIAELSGSVIPKLNWSAPKDATWIAATNSMDCRTPNDIYLLLKSSDFITHDLEQVFDDCKDDEESNSADEGSESEEEVDEKSYKEQQLAKIPYHLILRKTVPNFNPAMEFRCFVRSRHLLCICQRDLNHFSFLPPLLPRLRSLIQDFFNKHLEPSFPDDNFAFDVYIPQPHERVWLIDINPWALRTDPLLFSWLEILTMRGGEHGMTNPQIHTDTVRLYFNNNNRANDDQNGHITPPTSLSSNEDEEDRIVNDEVENIFTPEFRLVNRDDPEAYSFNTPQYSAHKLPKDVVDASADGAAGLSEFMGTWREILAKQERDDRENGDEEIAEPI